MYVVVLLVWIMKCSWLTYYFYKVVFLTGFKLTLFIKINIFIQNLNNRKQINK